MKEDGSVDSAWRFILSPQMGAHKGCPPPHPLRIAETPWDSLGQKAHLQCLFLQGKACPPVFFHRGRSERSKGRVQRTGLAGPSHLKHRHGTGLRG